MILVSVLLLGVAGSLGGLSRYAELASHFKVQYLFASAACLLTCLYFQEPVWAAAAALGVAINLAAVAPWYRSAKNATSNRGGRRLVKLILANVNHENAAHDTFIAFAQMHSPDALVVQEVTEAWRESLQALRNLYPFSEELPKEHGSGMALYSRFPFERLTMVLPEGDARPVILARMNIGGASVSLLSLHPRTPISSEHFKLRNGMLAAAADCLGNLPGPKICVGDLNITPWSPYYRSFVERTKIFNVRKGFGLFPSWPTFLFFKWLMIPLDHCLVSEDIHVVDVKTGESIGSDHLPLIIELELEVER
ncbi:MAG TPA: endonuclease/exonuclease/phosphatase family protein [Blastocatellia bacterium]|nr:endonuclease/exonuclease/phosphatase family protein [Blastocatellia bacterium]